MNDRELRIGIALCGAELAGTVHIGVLFGLEQLGIRPKHVAGTSAGALVASMYAHGYTFSEFRKAVRKFPGLFLLDYGFPMVSSISNLVRHPWKGKEISVPKGVFRGKRLQRYVKRILNHRLPKMPYYVVATDLYTTNSVAFSNDALCVQNGYAEQSTDLTQEISGSCSIPGLFTPVKFRKWMLVDGGVRDMVPVSILRQAGCNKIIAVDVQKLATNWYPVTMVDVLKRSLMALMDESTDSSDLQGDDVFVIKPEVNRTSWWSCREPMKNNIDLGYQHVLDIRQQILDFLSVKKHSTHIQRFAK
jgi:NTE family protein